MSDSFDLTSLFDTTAAPAGDTSMVADALSNSADTTTSVSDVANAADAGNTLDAASTGLDTSVPTDIPAPQPDAAANTDSGIPVGESSPPVKPMDGIDTTPMQPVQSGTLNSMDTMNQPGLIDRASQWAKENPAAAGSLGKALAGMGSGAMTALALDHKISAERDAEERHRQDVIRRGQVTKLPPSTFTPKPGGIINGVKGG